ncbi:MAG: glucose-6-phosphate isomerase [Burkholderiaceae bacterium]
MVAPLPPPLPSFAYASPEQSPAWQQLAALSAAPLPSLRDLAAAQDTGWPDRANALQFSAAGLRLDARHQAIGQTTWQGLIALAKQQKIAQWATAQRQGLWVNTTERRPALHALLRADPADRPPDMGQWLPNAHEVQAVFHERTRMLATAQALHEGRWRGFSGETITDVVNIGIGGSDLGPRMASQALSLEGLRASPQTATAHKTRVHFLSNPDPWSVYTCLASVRAATTVFVVQSKSFTTPETQRIAQTVQSWMAAAGCPSHRRMDQWIAVTARPDLAEAAEYRNENIFQIWPWVGGRTSVWSSIGLPLAVAIGAQGFNDFLAGARAMDTHFWTAPIEKNMPMALALLGLWNQNFLRCPSQAIAVYSSPLAGFVPYLQQLEMESNGKRVHLSGQPAQIPTGPIVWGGLGIDGQHAYFQLLHQGRHRVAVDFIAVENDDCPLPEARSHQAMVLDNLRAQAQALAFGRTTEETSAALSQEGLTAADNQRLTPHRSFPGNTPNSTVWLTRRDPAHLGALLALYEHKVFCQAMLLQIQPFDQWGVELGKSLLSS